MQKLIPYCNHLTGGIIGLLTFHWLICRPSLSVDADPGPLFHFEYSARGLFHCDEQLVCLRACLSNLRLERLGQNDSPEGEKTRYHFSPILLLLLFYFLFIFYLFFILFFLRLVSLVSVLILAGFALKDLDMDRNLYLNIVCFFLPQFLANC
jgi:hypothetical protein